MRIKTGFGWIEVNGETYREDIVIHVDGKITYRDKSLSRHLRHLYGHTPLTKRELEFLEQEKPEIVYIGTGQYGALPITEDARKYLSKFKTIIKPTPEAIKDIEKENRKYTAILHVTC